MVPDHRRQSRSVRGGENVPPAAGASQESGRDEHRCGKAAAREFRQTQGQRSPVSVVKVMTARGRLPPWGRISDFGEVYDVVRCLQPAEL